jgi:hypothetical protein
MLRFVRRVRPALLRAQRRRFSSKSDDDGDYPPWCSRQAVKWATIAGAGYGLFDATTKPLVGRDRADRDERRFVLLILDPAFYACVFRLGVYVWPICAVGASVYFVGHVINDAHK